MTRLIEWSLSEQIYRRAGTDNPIMDAFQQRLPFCHSVQQYLIKPKKGLSAPRLKHLSSPECLFYSCLERHISIEWSQSLDVVAKITDQSYPLPQPTAILFLCLEPPIIVSAPNRFSFLGIHTTSIGENTSLKFMFLNSRACLSLIEKKPKALRPIIFWISSMKLRTLRTPNRIYVRPR